MHRSLRRSEPGQVPGVAGEARLSAPKGLPQVSQLINCALTQACASPAVARGARNGVEGA